MVRKIETGLVFLPILVGVVFLGWAIHTREAEDAVNEAGARALGFADFTEEASAKAVGVLTADAWRAKLADDLANKKAADEALAKAQEERRRKWDADAPKRAMEAEEIRKRELAAWEDRQPPDRRMKLTHQSWTTGGFDTIGMMNFTVKNENDYAVKDFVISCAFHANSGTFLGDRQHTVYETIKAKSSRTFSKVNIGFIPSQSARGGCSLVSAVRN